jgi:transposase
VYKNLFIIFLDARHQQLTDNWMRETYPSDISKEQFEAIRGLLETSRKKTRPREVELYDVFCSVLYLLKGGGQWRMLPKDHPKWSTVYSYFAQWSKRPGKKTPSLLEQALKKCGWRGPCKVGTQRQDHVPNHRRAKREKHGYRRNLIGFFIYLHLP